MNCRGSLWTYTKENGGLRKKGEEKWRGGAKYELKYQLPGRVEAYFSVVNFIDYELIAAVLWKLRQYDNEISFEELMNEADKKYEVEMTSRGRKEYRWTHMTNKVKKIFDPYGITSLQT